MQRIKSTGIRLHCSLLAMNPGPLYLPSGPFFTT